MVIRMTIREIQRERLQKYIAAEDAILAGQSYTIGQRTLARPDLAEVQEVISELIASGVTLEDEPLAGRSKRVVFTD